LDKLWALDEIKARQRSRDRIILEGDRNTSYFHVIVILRFRKKRKETLKGRDGLVHETDEILRIAADYYKDLFRKEDRGHFSLVENFWEQEDKLPTSEREGLETPFKEEEIKAAVSSCYPKGALGQMASHFYFSRNSGG
jgi:hypothetical protein